MKEYEELLKEFGMERKPESEKEEKKASEWKPKQDIKREPGYRQETKSQEGMSGVFDGTAGNNGSNFEPRQKRQETSAKSLERNRTRGISVPRADLSTLPWRNILLLLAVVIVIVLIVVNISAIIGFLTTLFTNVLYIVLVVGISAYLIRRIIRGR